MPSKVWPGGSPDRARSDRLAPEGVPSSELPILADCLLVTQPRLPFAVATNAPRGLKVAARYGQAWVTTGHPRLCKERSPERSVAALRWQVEKL
ncbi:hypothetical protein GCM10010095_18630 [Streptomyces anthocyanicus]|nr:hypothetical protein GCM10010095_18630 [Streptomyces anthocyanicus]